jgi:hypothetical protein
MKQSKKIEKIDLIKLAQDSFDIGVSRRLAKKINEIIDYLNTPKVKEKEK